MAAKGKHLFSLWIFVCFLSILERCVAAKLNVPKLLLPYYSAVPTNYTLEVSEGCFTWDSTRPEVATVIPLNARDGSQCASKAVVSAMSRVPSTKTAIIMAKDSVTNQQLRCDVIVDDIRSIEIVTTTKELYLDDTPEEFEIRAISEKKDVFSSLDGVEFEWNLLPDTEGGAETVLPAHSVLRFLKFSESHYDAPPFIQDLEEKGKRGDRILVRGIRTGSARVSARLVDKAYKAVKEDIVRIIVIANIQLNPPLVYLLQYSTVSYRVELLKQGITQEITMPSQQYQLRMDDDKIASLDTASSVATALTFGDTEIKLKDRNFDVFPGRNWVLQTNRTYEIVIHIYDKESHKIFPSEGIRIEALFPKEYFEVLSSSKNGSYHIVTTKQRGFVTIEGELNAVIHTDGTRHTLSPVVEGSQEVEIYDPVSVKPKLLVLPWDPLAKNIYQHQLQATGGSGNYTWVSGDTKVATVTARGLITAANTVGHTTVVVSDARNPAHYDTMEIYVLPPGGMEYQPHRVEAEIGTHLELPLVVYGKHEGKKFAFDRCELMPFNTAVEDTGFFDFINVLPPSAQGSCANVKVKAKYVGHTKVTSTYRYQDVKLNAVVTIAAYKPLKPIDPEEIAVVTPASSKEVIFEGGPQPWILDVTGYYQKVKAEKPELLKMTPVKAYESRKTFHIFHVTCLKLGEQTIQLDVGNNPTSRNKFPASSTATVRFACAEPKGLRLVPLVAQPEGLPPCPVNLEVDDPVPAHCYRPLDLSVSVRDSEGRRFDNFSSLALDWELSDNKLASFKDGAKSVAVKLEKLESGRRVTEAYKTLLMKSVTGPLRVTASITRYNAEYNSHQLTLQTPIRTERELNLVNDALIRPEYLTVYNHNTNKAALQLLQGSGHFHMDYSNSNLASVNYDQKTRDITVTPVTEGTFTITASDLCLVAETTAKATVFVSDVYQILLYVVDKVELGKEIQARVQVIDRSNQAIPAKYFSMMSLKAKTGSDIITLKPSADKPSDDITAIYVVHGAALGRTTLQFVANQKSGKMVSSQAKEIQVFPPLRLSPRNITLIVGAIYQVTAHGGPLPESTIEFSIANDTVATVTSGGLTETRELGTTRVVGKAVGVDAESGYIVYSQDEVTLNVIELEGIKIYAPLKRLQTDTMMPIYAMGIHENEAPFSFGSAVPPLIYHWTISNSEVAKIQPLFYKSGIRPSAENNFAVRFSATNAGHVTVGLTVEPSPGSRLQIRDNAKLRDSVQIQVFERLRVLNPDICDGLFVMTPNTDAVIKTNRDGSSAKLTYTVIDRDALTSNQDPVVMVTDGGHVTSYERSGEVSLLIRSQEDFGVNQSLVILVKVKPVSYLMLNADTVIRTRGQQLGFVPVGATLHFTVSFHDNVGIEFYATNSKIKYRPNRNDLLQLDYGTDNNTLVAKATNPGQTVLKVWDKANPQLADYVSIDVGSAIYPAGAEVNLGDVVCFSSPIVGENGQRGSWLSSTNAVHLEDGSGIGVAAQVGKTLVSFSPNSQSTTHTQVVVSPVSRVSLKTDHVHQLSNVVGKTRVEVVSVVLEGAATGSEGNVHGPNCTERLKDLDYQLWRLPYTCEVTMTTSHHHIRVEDLVKVSAVFDPKTGQHQCQLHQQTGSHDLIQLISTLDTSVQLQALVQEREGQPRVASAPISLPFVPAFYIHTSELQISNLLPKVQLRISATDRVLKDIRVTSSDESLLRVSAPERGSHVDYSAAYHLTLQLTPSLWTRSQTDVSVEVVSVATGQSQTVPVRVKLLGETGQQTAPSELSWTEVVTVIGQNYQGVLLVVISVIVAICAMVIAHNVVMSQRYQAAAAANTSGMFTPMSPQQQGSPLAQSPWASPQTLTQQGSPTRLWTVDTGPFKDTSGIFKRSPVPRS